jgi:hypothetical protein
MWIEMLQTMFSSNLEVSLECLTAEMSYYHVSRYFLVDL